MKLSDFLKIFSIPFKNKLITISFFLFYYSKSQSIQNNLEFNLSEFNFKIKPTAIKFLNFDKDKILDLLSYENNSLNIYLGDSTGNFTLNEELLKSKTITEIKSSDLNSDNLDDIILVHHDLNKIQILIQDTSDLKFKSFEYDVNFYPDNLLIYDLNQDGISDICVFGKSSTGVTILVGKKNGTFQSAEILFDEIPISNIYPVNINNDKTIDLCVLNWLTNELIFFAGMGNLDYYIFDQLKLKHETNNLFFMKFNSDKYSDYIISNNNKYSFFVVDAQSKTREIYSNKTKNTINKIDTFSSKQDKYNYIFISTEEGEIDLLKLDLLNNIVVANSQNIKNDKVFLEDLDGNNQKEIILLNDNNLKILWLDKSSSNSDKIVFTNTRHLINSN